MLWNDAMKVVYLPLILVDIAQLLILCIYSYSLDFLLQFISLRIDFLQSFLLPFLYQNFNFLPLLTLLNLLLLSHTIFSYLRIETFIFQNFINFQLLPKGNVVFHNHSHPQLNFLILLGVSVPAHAI